MLKIKEKKMSDQGLLVVLSGFSGAGKGTLIKALMDKYPNDYCLSISATTRAKREGEVHGVDYFFLEEEEFLENIREERLLEYARYVDNYYGTPKEYVLEKMADGKNVILEIEIQGALKIREKIPDCILLFITPGEAMELERRLKKRGTETEDAIKNRLRRAAEEADYMKEYDYIILNEDTEKSLEMVHNIISSEKLKTGRNKQIIYRITEDLKAYTKEIDQDRR